LARFMNYMFAQGILTTDTFTAQRQGQLVLSAPDSCTRRYFEWGTRYTRSRQFGPHGAAPPGGNGADPPPTGGDNEQDNDGV
jgi:hypothetical protein